MFVEFRGERSNVDLGIVPWSVRAQGRDLVGTWASQGRDLGIVLG